uniref:Ninein-like n=1 Tax=Petromyzon marinus TaxID=7757 RepID=A0AAJ7XF34_PETMA|nr:ninein-like [Petromyzon marinus]XP_032830919.1 ninein-like [Petromyzon marinus]XP_032830920.1 ninein-like [Petromyzon marinus]
MDAHAGPWLFSALDDGSGSVSCERMLEFWHREGITDAGAILQALGLDCRATVSLDELCRLVDEQLPCAGGYAAQALLVACKHEVAQLRSWLGELGAERDSLRASLRSARLHAEQLARDADEQVASANAHHHADLRRLEQAQAEALATLRSERERELERSEREERAWQAELGRLHAERRQLRSEVELAYARCSRLETELADAGAQCAVGQRGVCDPGLGEPEPGGSARPSLPIVRPGEVTRLSRQSLNKTNYCKSECKATESQENGVEVCGNKTGQSDEPADKRPSWQTSEHIHNNNNNKTCQQGIEQCGTKPARRSEQLSREQFGKVSSEHCKDEVREKCDKLTKVRVYNPSSGQVSKLASAQSNEQTRDHIDKLSLKHNVKETKEYYRQVREQTIIQYREQTNIEASKPVLAPTNEQANGQCSEQFTEIVTELNGKTATEPCTEQHSEKLPELVSKESAHLAPDKQTVELTSTQTTKPGSEESMVKTKLGTDTSASECSAGHNGEQTSRQTKQQCSETCNKSGEGLGERACRQRMTAQSSGAPCEKRSGGELSVCERSRKFGSPSINSDAKGNFTAAPQRPNPWSRAAGLGAAALGAALDEAVALLQRLEALALQLLSACCPQGTLLLRVLWSGLYSHAEWFAPPLSWLYQELARARQLLTTARRQHRSLSTLVLAAPCDARGSPERPPASRSAERAVALSGRS